MERNHPSLVQSGTKPVNPIIRGAASWQGFLPRSLLRIRPPHFYGSFVLIALGLLSPSFLNVHSFGVWTTLRESLEYSNAGYLVEAAVRLVLLNTVRAMPFYVGAFLAMDGLRYRRPFWVDILASFGIIVAAYYMIQAIHGIRYDFRMPALIQILGISLVLRLNAAEKGLLTKTVLVGQLLFGLQWLDIVPRLTRYGFGHGELSQAIKAAASIIEGGEALNLLGFILCAVLTMNAFLTAKFMIDYFRHIRLVEADRESRLSVEAMRSEALRARFLLESQALVHDLKTPLTTITGMTSVIEQLTADPHIRTYLAKISEYCDRMNSLISQVLHGDVRTVVSGHELAKRLSAQLPSEKTAQRVHFHVEQDLPEVEINIVRVVRALVNLVNNAVWAVGSRPLDGRVQVSFTLYSPETGPGGSGTLGTGVKITVSDNGVGITPDHMERIWETGFSTRFSSGLGLKFAREVIHENNGLLVLESVPGKGTTCQVLLPSVGGGGS